MFDFLALEVVAEFDDYFVEMYGYSNIGYLIGSSVTLQFKNLSMPKRTMPNRK